MKISFIGTGSGKASLNRNHSSLLFISEEYNLLIDAGDGISRALMSNGINFETINGILFTHLHPDHFSGLPSLIVQMKIMNRKESLDIFIHESLKAIVEDSLLRTYLLSDKMEFEIHYKTFADDERFMITKEFSFLARKNSHLVKLEKYKVNYQSLSLYSASFLFEAGDKKVIYTSDIGSEEDLLLFGDYVTDILISETTHISPFAIIEKEMKINPGKVYLTHYSDEDIPAISEILANLPSDLKEKVKLAIDHLSFEI